MNLLFYGDSREPVQRVKQEVVEAVEWWITQHVTSDFVHVDLPITRQIDSFSCGVFAVNAVQHLVFPEITLLRPQDSVTECYRWFIAVVDRHNEVVRHSCLISVSVRSNLTHLKVFTGSDSKSLTSRPHRHLQIIFTRWGHFLRKRADL